VKTTFAIECGTGVARVGLNRPGAMIARPTREGACLRVKLFWRASVFAHSIVSHFGLRFLLAS